MSKEISEKQKQEIKEQLVNVGDTYEFAYNTKDKKDYMRQTNAIRYQCFKNDKKVTFEKLENGKAKAIIVQEGYKGPKSSTKKTTSTSKTNNQPKQNKTRGKKKYPIQPFVKMNETDIKNALKEAKSDSKIAQAMYSLSKPKECFFVPKDQMGENTVRTAVYRENGKGKRKYSCNKLKHEGQHIGYKIMLQKAA